MERSNFKELLIFFFVLISLYLTFFMARTAHGAPCLNCKLCASVSDGQGGTKCNVEYALCSDPATEFGGFCVTKKDKATGKNFCTCEIKLPKDSPTPSVSYFQ